MLGILIDGNSNNDDSNNNQTTYSSPANESVASFVSSEFIDAAAKIIQYSSPQQCSYGEALEYVGVPRDYANTVECKSRLRKEIDVINVYHGVPRFKSSKNEFKNRYKTIFRLIPCTVTIENKHNRLLTIIGLPLLPPPPFSVMVNGKK